MINPEQNLVVEKMLLKELNVDADQLVLLVKITNVEQVKEVNQKEEKPEHLNWNKTKGYMVGSNGEDNMSWFDIIKLSPNDRRRRMYADLEGQLEDIVITGIDKLMEENEFISVAEIGPEPVSLPGTMLMVDAEDEDYVQLYVGRGDPKPIGTIDYIEGKLELQEDLLDEIDVGTLRQIVPTEKQRMARDMKRFQNIKYKGREIKE